MDAWLVVTGLLPEVDFIGRQPLYTLLYTPLVWLGGDYQAARLVPVFATLLAALVIRAIGRSCSPATGDIAALLFLYSPTILINSNQIKTEPPVILLGCLAVWSYLEFFRQDRLHWLAVAGGAAGLGYYVRESALAVLLALLLTTVASTRSGKGALVLLSAWTGVVGAALVIFSRWLPWDQMLQSDRLFPPAALLGAAVKLMGFVEPAAEGVRMSSQPWIQTLRQLADPVLMNAPLLGLAVAGLAPSRDKSRRIVLLSATWIACLGFLYFYHVVRHGFFQEYFLEFLPPLSLLAALGLSALEGPELSIRPFLWLPAFLGVGLLAGLILPHPNHTAAFIGLTVVVFLGGALYKYRGHSLARGCLLGSLLGAWLFAGAKVGLAYHSPFAPETVLKVSHFLEERTGPDDEVLSGAVIWEFEARRRAFANWSHPLSLDSPSKKPELWRTLFAANPPKAIVWDQTAASLFSQFPEVVEALESDYRMEVEVDGIKIYLKH